MDVLHYRSTDYCDNPWQQLIINDETQIADCQSKTIVSINGQTVIRQHASTYITGKDSCQAHHFAKMIAVAVLKGEYEHAPGLNVTPTDEQPATVLWVDSVRGVHPCADFFNEMISRYDNQHKQFSLLCLSKLGHLKYDFYGILSAIEEAIKRIKPTLLVIDDIDHLMPYCGVNVASAFNHVIRDTLNHTDTACLFIGYNHLGKQASTTGNLGKLLFPEANNIFSVTTQYDFSKVRLVRSFMYQANSDAEFLFKVDGDNLPHEVVSNLPERQNRNFIRQNTLRDIISEVVNPGETISPDQLFDALNNRRQQLNRIDRTRALIAQATQLGIIKKASGSNDYTLCREAESVISPSTPSSDCPEGCASSTNHAPGDGINNSLTLPPHLPGSLCRGSATAPSSPIPRADPVPSTP